MDGLALPCPFKFYRFKRIPSQYLKSTEHTLIVEVWCSFHMLLHILIVWKECMYNQMNSKKQGWTLIYSKPVNLCAEFWLPTLYLALGPGFVGHTGLNAVLRYTSSLVIAMAVTLEPPLGTAVGWILHVTPPPGYINDNPSHIQTLIGYECADAACVICFLFHS